MLRFKRNKKITPITPPVTSAQFAPVFNRPIFQSIDANDVRIHARIDESTR